MQHCKTKYTLVLVGLTQDQRAEVVAEISQQAAVSVSHSGGTLTVTCPAAHNPPYGLVEALSARYREAAVTLTAQTGNYTERWAAQGGAVDNLDSHWAAVGDGHVERERRLPPWNRRFPHRGGVDHLQRGRTGREDAPPGGVGILGWWSRRDAGGKWRV